MLLAKRTWAALVPLDALRPAARLLLSWPAVAITFANKGRPDLNFRMGQIQKIDRVRAPWATRFAS